MNRKPLTLSAALLPLIAGAPSAAAPDVVDPGNDRSGISTIYNNGDPDGLNGYSNQTLLFRRALLDDFVVPPGQVWFVEEFHWRHIWQNGPYVFSTGLELLLRTDESGAPGPVYHEVDTLEYDQTYTGNIHFSREEIAAWVTFEPIAFPAGHYWFEAVILAGQENDFWLTAPLQNAECWVNYWDLCGLCPGSEQFGVESDLAWSLVGRDATGAAACCLVDGQCFEMEFADCNEAGGIYQGSGVDCSPPLCSAPRACCFDDGTCETATKPFCTAAGGFFAGAGSSCSTFQCAGSAFCFSQEVFGPGPRPVAFTLGDLDGQSGPDLVSPTTVRLNDGSGLFHDAVTYDTVNGAFDVALADLDGDLDLDTAVVARSAGKIAVHLNDGTGTIGSFVEYPAGLRPHYIRTGDLDGDLDEDLAVTDENGNRVLVFLNDGAGAFAPFAAYATIDPRHLAIADLDGDLDLDLAVTNQANDTVSVLLNTGNATFAVGVPYATARFPFGLVADDLDGDMDVDLAVTCLGEDVVSVLKNNGDGTFADDARYGTGGGATIAVIDTAADGTGDLVVPGGAGGDEKVWILINDGHGVFGERFLYPVAGAPSDVVAGDLDADDDIDLVIRTSNSGSIVTIFNDCVPCPGDLDHSGDVGFADILRILTAWGMKGGPEDLDVSGFVDFGDLLFVLGAWGVCG